LLRSRDLQVICSDLVEERDEVVDRAQTSNLLSGRPSMKYSLISAECRRFAFVKSS
jgi:hypothetical protein